MKKYAYFQGFLLAIFLSVLFVHQVFAIDNYSSIVALLSLGVLFLVIEFYQIYMNKLQYIQDFWNLFDLSRCIITICYSVLRL